MFATPYFRIPLFIGLMVLYIALIGSIVPFLAVVFILLLLFLLAFSGKLPQPIDNVVRWIWQRLPFSSQGRTGSAVVKAKDTTAKGSAVVSEKKRREQCREEARSALEGLLGAEEALESVNRLINQIQHAAGGSGFGVHAKAVMILLSGPAGTGKTYISEVVGKLFYGFDVLPSSRNFSLTKNKLVFQDAGSLFETIASETHGGTLIFDDADWLFEASAQSDERPIGEIGSALQEFVNEYPDNFLIVVNGSSEKLEELIVGTGHKWLRDFHVITASTRHLELNELLELADRRFEERDFSLENEAVPLIEKQLKREFSDKKEHFENAFAVSQLVNRVIAYRSQDVQSNASRIIRAQDVEGAFNYEL